MSDNTYGSRPHLLPGFARRGAAKEGSDIRVLSFDESRELEAVSLNKFGHSSSGVLMWDGVPVLNSLAYEDEEEQKQMLRRVIAERIDRASTVAIFWGTLDLPSLTMPVDVATQNLAELVELGPNFWLFSPEDGILIESRNDGPITVVRT
jgi:hypothetical protein